MNAAEPIAYITRGDGIEAVHYGSVAVVNAEGRLTHFFGDPTRVSMTRSAIKPIQLMPLLLTGAADHYGFDTRQLAIMCGSHIGSDEHRTVVYSNLERSGSRPTDLKCGTHWPLGMKEREDYPLADEDKDPMRHNCSGKHSGFLALSRFLKDDPKEYLDPENKAQTLVRRNLAAFCEVDEEILPRGIDGCSAPNYGLPLTGLAAAFMKIADLQGRSEEERTVLARVREAMTEYPEMVSGEGRFDLALARSFPGRLICKIGAEALEAIGLSDPPMGIVVKIHDGGERALGAVCVEVLHQLGIIPKFDNFPYIKPYERPEVRNARHLITGHVVTDFKLNRAG